jgi:hypothetical protein
MKWVERNLPERRRASCAFAVQLVQRGGRRRSSRHQVSLGHARKIFASGLRSACVDSRWRGRTSRTAVGHWFGPSAHRQLVRPSGIARLGAHPEGAGGNPNHAVGPRFVRAGGTGAFAGSPRRSPANASDAAILCSSRARPWSTARGSRAVGRTTASGSAVSLNALALPFWFRSSAVFQPNDTNIQAPTSNIQRSSKLQTSNSGKAQTNQDFTPCSPQSGTHKANTSRAAPFSRGSQTPIHKVVNAMSTLVKAGQRYPLLSER